MMVQERKAGIALKHSAAMPAILAEMEALTGGKLWARKEDDTVNGYVSLAGDNVIVVLYDKDAAPCAEHATTFKKLPTMPSTEAVKAAISSAEVTA